MLLNEVKKAEREIVFSMGCNIGSFQSNIRKLMKLGYTKNAAYAIAYSKLAYACERLLGSAREQFLTMEDLTNVIDGILELCS